MGNTDVPDRYVTPLNITPRRRKSAIQGRVSPNMALRDSNRTVAPAFDSAKT
jgi:hypothetical protein